MNNTVEKAERVRALAKKLGFKNTMLVLQPDHGMPFHFVVDTDAVGPFTRAIATNLADFVETYIDEDGHKQ